jgi:hypothetical protein
MLAGGGFGVELKEVRKSIPPSNTHLEQAPEAEEVPKDSPRGFE